MILKHAAFQAPPTNYSRCTSSRLDQLCKDKMAVSPVITYTAPSNNTNFADKVRVIAVRGSANGTGLEDTAANNEAEPELAEQLNEETKGKYVKGLVSR